MNVWLGFLIIGAEKAGTTWLADMLRQHPGIYIPPQKELFYFNRQFFESPELHNYNFDQPATWYRQFFKAAAAGQLLGEASPAYLWDQAAPARIREFAPGVRLVAVLRDPVERAFSQYLYFIQRGYFGEISFEQALVRRPDLVSRGLYAAQLGRYLELFPREQLSIHFFDDLQRDSRAFLQAVQAFLGVAPLVPENIDLRQNVTGRPRFAWFNRLIAVLRYPLRKYNPPLLMRLLRASGLARLQERLRLANTRPLAEKPAIAAQTRARLRETFRQDILELQRLAGRDLGAWFDG